MKMMMILIMIIIKATIIGLSVLYKHLLNIIWQYRDLIRDKINADMTNMKTETAPNKSIT